MKNRGLGRKLNEILIAVFVSAVGLAFLKYLPMLIWGSDILFDASAHMVATSLILFVIWQFMRKSKFIKIIFYIISITTLYLMAVHRIEMNEHNEVGIALGLIVVAISIFVAKKARFKAEK